VRAGGVEVVGLFIVGESGRRERERKRERGRKEALAIRSGYSLRLGT